MGAHLKDEANVPLQALCCRLPVECDVPLPLHVPVMQFHTAVSIPCIYSVPHAPTFFFEGEACRTANPQLLPYPWLLGKGCLRLCAVAYDGQEGGLAGAAGPHQCQHLSRFTAAGDVEQDLHKITQPLQRPR